MNTANIELLRNRAIARNEEIRHEAACLDEQRRHGARPERIAQQQLVVARLEGEAAGSLFALREAEYDRAAASEQLDVGVDVVSTHFDSGAGRVERHDADLAAPWGVRWDRTGRLGWCEAHGLRVVGRGVS